MSLPKFRIGVHATDVADGAMLAEWLHAAGFTPVPGADGDEPCRAHVVRWPVAFDLARLQGPVILLHGADTELPPWPSTVLVEPLPLPDHSDVRSLLAWSTLLIGTLRRLVPVVAATAPTACRVDPTARRAPCPALVAVGVSTGGPEALRELLTPLAGLHLPQIVVVQHIPTNFLGDLVARLSRQSGYPCAVACDGQPLAAGTCWFAPGERHLRVVGGAGAFRARASDEPPLRGHRPAAEILFESCVELGVRGAALIMTGMGQDGAHALLRLRQAGWATIGQDEATCAIYGMPRAAKALGAVDRELPLAELGPWVAMICRATTKKTV